ncbi:MAG: hypothetical protein AB8B63_19725 [Granulosicoccus sp.]
MDWQGRAIVNAAFMQPPFQFATEPVPQLEQQTVDAFMGWTAMGVMHLAENTLHV